MSDVATLMVALRCGKLAWLCCIPEDQLRYAHDLITSLTVSELHDVHRWACACTGTPTPGTGPTPGTPTPGPGGQPTPGAGDDCDRRLRDALCSGAGASALSTLGSALDALNTPLPDELESAITVLRGAVTAVQTACAAPAGLTTAVTSRLCGAWKKVIDGMATLPSPVAFVLNLALGPFSTTGFIGTLLTACCKAATPQLGAAPTTATLSPTALHDGPAMAMMNAQQRRRSGR